MARDGFQHQSARATPRRERWPNKLVKARSLEETTVKNAVFWRSPCGVQHCAGAPSRVVGSDVVPGTCPVTDRLLGFEAFESIPGRQVFLGVRARIELSEEPRVQWRGGAEGRSSNLGESSRRVVSTASDYPQRAVTGATHCESGPPFHFRCEGGAERDRGNRGQCGRTCRALGVTLSEFFQRFLPTSKSEGARRRR